MQVNPPTHTPINRQGISFLSHSLAETLLHCGWGDALKEAEAASSGQLFWPRSSLYLGLAGSLFCSSAFFHLKGTLSSYCLLWQEELCESSQF